MSHLKLTGEEQRLIEQLSKDLEKFRSEEVDI